MALNIQQQRIAHFLAQGLKPAQICGIVGVTPSYISQLLSEDGPEEFKEFVKAETLEMASKVDEDALLSAKYMSAEHKILKAIEDSIVMAELPVMIQALKVIGDRQEKRASRKAGLTSIAQMVSNNQTNITVLTLPAHAVPEYEVNGQGQVVAIDGQGMSPLSSNGVKQLFAARKEGMKLVQALPVADGNGLEQGNGTDF